MRANWPRMKIGKFDCDHFTRPMIPVQRQQSMLRSNKANTRRLVVVIVTTPKQDAKLLYAISRWERANFAPCRRRSEKGNFGLMLIQSGLAHENHLAQLASRVSQYDSVQKCFSEVTHTFVTLPTDGYHDGPANMFKEIILGDNTIGFDYAMQLEPDVFPITQNWLSKLLELTRGEEFGSKVDWVCIRII